jgi:hypothetical protein
MERATAEPTGLIQHSIDMRRSASSCFFSELLSFEKQVCNTQDPTTNLSGSLNASRAASTKQRYYVKTAADLVNPRLLE